ncbi:MAG: glycosyltransferase [Actinomycetota bacterium]
MKILHVTPSCFPATYWGGPMFTVYALNRALAAIPGVELKLLTTDSAGPARGQRLDPDRIAGLYPDQDVIMARRMAGASMSWGLLRHLPRLVKWADVVHLTAIYSFPTIPTLAICRLMGKPVVWSPHGAVQDAYEWSGSRNQRLKRLWEALCNALAVPGKTVTHVTSEREGLPTRARLPRARAVVVPNGVDIPNALPGKAWMPGGTLRLLYLGRLARKKGIENLLQAMAQLADSAVSLSICGTGEPAYEASLRELASSLGLLGKSVSFVGHVDGEARERAFLQADVCVVPSHTECFCMVVAEALARGVPVIASQGTPWSEVEAEECGLWVGNEPDALAEAIQRIRAMALPDMGARGRQWMIREFRWNGLARRMLDIYRSLIR